MNSVLDAQADFYMVLGEYLEVSGRNGIWHAMEQCMPVTPQMARADPGWTERNAKKVRAAFFAAFEKNILR